jgi:hypothetical protein
VEAASQGHVEILTWAQENGFWSPKKKLCPAAAGAGNLPLLKWLIEQECLLGDSAHAAAIHGKIEILEFLTISKKPTWSTRTARKTARAGHLDVLIWFESKIPEFSAEFLRDPKICEAAAKAPEKRSEILTWLVERGATLTKKVN